MASPPFTINETSPSSGDFISAFPTNEQSFRDVVESWLLLISTNMGVLRADALPTTFAEGFSVTKTMYLDAGDTDDDVSLIIRDESDVVQASIVWDESSDNLQITMFADDGTTSRSQLILGGDSAAFTYNGSNVLTAASTDATAITGTGALNAGSITSGFGAINIGTDAITAGAASFTSMASSGAVSGTTGTFSGAVSGTTGTFSSNVTSSANFLSSTTTALLATSAAGSVFLRPNGAGSTSGQVALASTGALTVNGAITATGDITAGSDKRLKKNIKKLSRDWAADAVRNVNPVSFKRRKTNAPGIGFVAQDVQAWYPELVTEGEDGFLRLAYGNMVAVLWAEVQRLQELVEAR